MHDDLGSSLTRISLLSDLARADRDNPAQVEALGLTPGRYLLFVGRLVPEKGIDLLKYRRELSEADINTAIKELTDAGVLDEVKKIASDLVTASNRHLSLLPESKERALLMDIGEFFVTRSF